MSSDRAPAKLKKKKVYGTVDFDILINNPHQTNYPGSEVSGKVVLFARTDITANEIWIIFSGRCNGSICSHAFDRNMDKCIRGTAYLFNYRRLLFTGNYRFLAGNRYEWPFSFVFPSMATHQGAATEKWQKSRHWEYDFGHSLPPTFETSSVFKAFGASVDYRLEAGLYNPVSTFTVLPCRFNTVKMLQLMDAREHDEVDPVIIEEATDLNVHSSRLSSDNRMRPQSIKDIMRIIAGDSSMRTVIFCITTNIPSQVMCGAEVPMSIRAECLSKQTNVDKIPRIYLRGLIVKLEAKSFIQATDTDGITSHRFHSETKTIGRSKKLNIPLDEEDLNSTNVLTTLCHGRNICPGFSSYSIKRAYDLHVKFLLRSADRKLEVRRLIKNFQVLSKPYRTQEITDLPPYQSDPHHSEDRNYLTDVQRWPAVTPNTDPPEYQP